MGKSGISKAQQRQETMQTLISISRDVFAEHGFANTALEDIVQQAGVTRGALYHHFGSKEGLFRAVLETVQEEVAQRIEQAAQQHEHPWKQLIAGCEAFLEANTDKTIQRIMLVDGPAVLGWDVWRETDAKNSVRLLQEVLTDLKDQGVIKALPITALTQLLSGAMNELALWIVQSENPQAALREAQTTLSEVLSGIKRDV
jgi:AcrR family transcriptional regulator